MRVKCKRCGDNFRPIKLYAPIRTDGIQHGRADAFALYWRCLSDANTHHAYSEIETYLLNKLVTRYTPENVRRYAIREDVSKEDMRDLLKYNTSDNFYEYVLPGVIT